MTDGCHLVQAGQWHKLWMALRYVHSPVCHPAVCPLELVCLAFCFEHGIVNESDGWSWRHQDELVVTSSCMHFVWLRLLAHAFALMCIHFYSHFYSYSASASGFLLRTYALGFQKSVLLLCRLGFLTQKSVAWGVSLMSTSCFILRRVLRSYQ